MHAACACERSTKTEDEQHVYSTNLYSPAMSVAPLAQALKTLWHATAVDQDSDKAKSAQKTFIQACEKQGTQKVSEVSEQIPLSRQVKGMCIFL